jgi:hypothetical protein
MRTLLLTVLALAASELRAQLPHHLIGLTRNMPLVNQRSHAACAQLPFCTVAGLVPYPLPWAGGSAWDPTRQILWLSNGPSIAAVLPDTCTSWCVTQPAPIPTGAYVAGLEYVESQDELWMIDSNAVLHRTTTACQPTVLASCATGVPLGPNVAPGGLAVDECHGLVFYSVSNWSTNTTQLAVAAIATPCQPFAQLPVATACAGLLAVTGLAADGCRSVLYLTDGVITVAWSYTVAPGLSVTFGTPTCCTLPPPVAAANTLVGLAVRSGRASSVGTPCTNGACQGCPLTHVLRNSPNLGNASFGLDVQGAAFSTLIWCVVGHGACAANGPVLPPLCGPALVAPTITTIGPFTAPAGGGCYVYVPFHFPLPLLPGLCGVVLSSQFVALCPSGATFGTALSNCLSWELQGN